MKGKRKTNSFSGVPVFRRDSRYTRRARLATLGKAFFSKKQEEKPRRVFFISCVGFSVHPATANPSAHLAADISLPCS